MYIGIIGLGRMGMQIARRLHKKRHKVIAWNRSEAPRIKLAKFFSTPAPPPSSPPKSGERNKRRGGKSTVVGELSDLVGIVPRPRIVWVMLPAGEPTEEMIKLLSKRLSKGDIVIDGSNSFYLDSVKKANKLANYKIHYLDCGTSGGVWGEKNGFSLMVGGEAKVWKTVRPIFRDLAAAESPEALAKGEGSYGLVGPSGAGHFVKMVHNGIEYGMMEAIAEGFAILEKSPFKLDLALVAKVWHKGAVVSSWLVDLARDIFEKENLSSVVGFVKHTGEGEWTVKVAKKLGVDVRVIADALKVRKESESKKNQKLLRNKLLALLRNRFGGHEVLRK